MDKVVIVYRYILLKWYYQILLAAAVLLLFNVAMFILSNYKIFVLAVTINSLTSYLTSVTSIAGLVGALLLGYFFFFFQRVQAEEQNWYLALKAEIDKLIIVLDSIPAEFDYMFVPLFECVNFLQLRKLREFSIVGDDWESVSKPATIASEKGILGHPIIFRMMVSLAKIEEYGSELGISKIAIICSRLILNSVKKLFYILLISLGLILYFELAKTTLTFNPMMIGSIMIMVLFFVCMSILETLLHVSDYLRDCYPVEGEDEESEDDKSNNEISRV